MKKSVVNVLAAALVLGSVGAAKASLVITWPSATNAPPTGVAGLDASGLNPFPQNLMGYEGGFLTAKDAGSYVFTYLGMGDPSFTNTFSVSGCGVTFVNQTTTVGTSFTCNFAANTQIPFTFTANTTGSSPWPKTVTNGQTYSNGLGFLASMTNSTASTASAAGTSVYLGLSDGASTSDKDFQDLVVRVDEVPEPASFAVLGVGLLGLGIAWSRRRARA